LRYIKYAFEDGIKCTSFIIFYFTVKCKDDKNDSSILYSTLLHWQPAYISTIFSFDRIFWLNFV